MFNFNEIEPENLNLDYVYSKVTQEDIYKFCLNSDLVFHRHILSPYRKDSRPSFSIKRTPKGDIIWRDWGTGEYGDAINLVEQIYHCNHIEALKIIYANLIKGHISNNKDVRLHLKSRKPQVVEKKQTLIEVKKRPFCLADYEYWNSYGIQLKTLSTFDVFATENVWLNKFNYETNEYNGWRLLKEYKKSSPLFAYKFTRHNHLAYKVYSPLDTNFKWFSNTDEDDIQGYAQLPNFGEFLVMTKSLKDVMCLYEMGIPAVALQGEHVKLKHELFEKLLKRFPEIILFYDNDDAGVKASAKIAEAYSLPEIFIPSICKTKDISDTIKEKGFKYSESLMKKLLKKWLKK